MVTVVEHAVAAPNSSALQEEALSSGDELQQPAPTGSLRDVGPPCSLLPLQGCCEVCLAAGAAAHEASRLDYGSGVQLLVDVVASEEEALRGGEDLGGRQGALQQGVHLVL